jgi:cysteine synthase
MTLVESTSGNLGLALAYLAGDIGISTVCVVDPTVSAAKITKLREGGADVCFAKLDDLHKDYPSARIAEVRRLVQSRGWIWLNQYAAPAGMRAHEETTGPETWAATGGRLHCVVASVGTGGTICGMGRFLKRVDPGIQIIAVEPLGSTIFGGQPGPFMSAGSGLSGPSSIVRRFGNVIDFVAKVSDAAAVGACKIFAQRESYTIGITAAAAALVGRRVAERHPDWTVVSIAADGSESYQDALKSPDLVGNPSEEIAIVPVPLIAGIQINA